MVRSSARLAMVKPDALTTPISATDDHLATSPMEEIKTSSIDETRKRKHAAATSAAAKRRKGRPVRSVFRSFKTTPRLLEDEEMDSLLRTFVQDQEHYLVLPPCRLDQWGMRQFDVSESQASADLLQRLTVERQPMHVISVVLVDVEQKHPHWIVMLMNVAERRIYLVDSLSDPTKEATPEAVVDASKPEATDSATAPTTGTISGEASNDADTIKLFRQFQQQLENDGDAEDEHADQNTTALDVALQLVQLQVQLDAYLGEYSKEWAVEHIALGAQTDDFNCGVWVLEVVRHYVEIAGDMSFFCVEALKQTDIKSRRRFCSETLYPPKVAPLHSSTSICNSLNSLES